jgi:hypothetical protein
MPGPGTGPGPAVEKHCLKLCKILRVFPDKIREYYGMNIKTVEYILDSAKDDLQGYSNFRKCNEAEQKPTVALRYVLVIAVRIDINCICTMVNAIKIQCNLKRNYTRKINPINAELNPICHLLVLLGDLTFMGSCIVSIFQYLSNKKQRYTVYLYLETALHASGGTSTHHQKRIQLYLQHLVLVPPLLLSAAIVEGLEPV